VTFIKLYGIERSGTNYLAWLLNENFLDVRVLNNLLGWKHGTQPLDETAANPELWADPRWMARTVNPYWNQPSALADHVTNEMTAAVRDRTIRIVAIVKNPYAWYVSYKRKWEDVPVEKWRIANACHLRMCCEWPLAAMVRYEDLLHDLDGTLAIVGQRLSLSPAHDVFRDCGVALRPQDDLTWQQQRDGEAFDATYYRERRYMDELTASEKRRIRKAATPKLMKALGYGG